MLLPNLTVVLCRPKLSENIGSVARVCANMGCSSLSLVAPRALNLETARSLATNQGEKILSELKVHADVHQALAPMHRVYATTARTGGWRKRILLPDQAAAQIVDELESGLHVALLFGPEDTGLANAEVEQCSELVSIPTAPGAWSLNLSHAVLILLYACFQCQPAGLKRKLPADSKDLATQAELRLLFEIMQNTLQRIDFLAVGNDFLGPERQRGDSKFYSRLNWLQFISNFNTFLYHQGTKDDLKYTFVYSSLCRPGSRSGHTGYL